MSEVSNIRKNAFEHFLGMGPKSLCIPGYNYRTLKAQNSPVEDWLFGAHAVFISVRDAAEWADQNSGVVGIDYHVIQYSAQGFFVEVTDYRATIVAEFEGE
jgi:hypothetical protein